MQRIRREREKEVEKREYCYLSEGVLLTGEKERKQKEQKVEEERRGEKRREVWSGAPLRAGDVTIVTCAADSLLVVFLRFCSFEQRDVFYRSVRESRLSGSLFILLTPLVGSCAKLHSHLHQFYCSGCSLPNSYFSCS